MTKFYAQEKQVFDINKVTVVGNLTITSDGIASGFKSYNSGDESYLTLPTVFNPQDKPWKIIIKATIGDWTSEKPYCSLLGTGIQGRDNQGIALALGGSNTIACWLGSTGTSWDIGTIRTNLPYISGKTYYFKVEFTGTKYVLSVSEDNINWEIKGSIESTTPIYVSAQPLTIGDNKYNNTAGTCWTGSIDLMETYIYIDNEVFFNPTKPVYSLERRKPMVWDKNNYSVVGSPIITSDGVATSIGGQNYVYIPPIDYTKPFAIKKIGFTRSAWGANYYFINGANTTSDWGGFTIGTNGATQKLRWFLGSTGTTWDMVNGWESTTLLELDKTYYVDLIYSGSDYTLILYDNNFNEIERQICNKSTAIYNSNKGIMIGSNYIKTTNEIFAGSIYLANLTIENDGVVVFDGGKQRYLYDSSKFTVVGSPTITEVGVITSESKSDYVTTIKSNTLYDKSWEIISKFTVNSENTSTYNVSPIYTFGAGTQYLAFGGAAFHTTLKRIYFTGKTISGTSGEGMHGMYKSFTDFVYGTTFLTKFTFDYPTKTYAGYYMREGIDTDWVLCGSKWVCTDENPNLLGTNNEIDVISIGIARDAHTLVGTSVDLTQFSITVDGKEVFTGAKEKFYAMRGM